MFQTQVKNRFGLIFIAYDLMASMAELGSILQQNVVEWSEECFI